ncbi:hypothetical protein [Haladaptatus salinisoli]|uniref:hypothetical protein n=1 Tax=Haladaptatus salinisoli TaxID=2884876 RepID=UPI001D0A36A9|nr:hypothetical protein [Haladaptatus salinisoli]
MSSNPTRRILLAGVGALVGSSSGCLGRAFSSEPVPADEYERTVSLREVDSVPDSYGAEFEIEVAHAEITAERSAVLRTRVTSASDEKPRLAEAVFRSANTGSRADSNRRGWTRGSVGDFRST